MSPGVVNVYSSQFGLATASYSAKGPLMMIVHEKLTKYNSCCR